MRYRNLGSTGMSVSEIGFGGWGIGGDLYGAISEEEALATLTRAAECGINFYDTAEVYGNGRSEDLIGRMFVGRRHEILIATKVGSMGHYSAQDFSAAHIHSAVEDSLRRLRTDYIDLYQLHSPPAALLTAEDESWQALEQLRQSGKVRAIGVSVRSPEDGLLAARLPGIAAIQVNFNLADQRALSLFDVCGASGIGVIIRTPLCFGFLSGRFTPSTHFEVNDHRATWSAEQRSLWAEAPGLFRQQAAKENRSATQFALSFCLAFEAVSCAIPGMMKVEEVDENAAVAGLQPLDEASVEEAKAIYQGRSFFLGRAAMTPPRQA